MNAISDGETVFQDGCTGSLVYCYVLLSLFLSPLLTANLFRLGSHTHAALLPTSLTEPDCAEMHWSTEAAPKKNKLMLRSAPEESSLQAFSKA